MVESTELKVIHIADLNMGGIYVLVRDLTRYQSTQQNMNVAILVPTIKGGSNTGEIHQTIAVHFGNLRSGYDLSPKKYFRIYKIFKKYDIIHIHGFHPLIGLCALISGKRIIYTEHGTFQQANLRLSAKKFFKKRILGFFFLEHFCSAVVFNSNWLKQDVNLKTNKTCVIHNGTNPRAPGERKRGDEGQFNILTVCRLVPRKRVDRLISAVSRMGDLGGVRLQIVGDGPLYGELSSLADSLLPPGSFFFYGVRRDVSEFYENADIFVLPTQFEPFGLVAVEAMFSGVIVLCFRDGGGVLEILDGVHERLIAGDEDELAGNIRYWRENGDERELVVQKLRERASEHFTTHRMAEDYQNLYQKIL